MILEWSCFIKNFFFTYSSLKFVDGRKCLGVHINSQENYVFHLGASSKKICCHNTYHERYNRNIVTLIQCVKKINELFKLFVRKKIGSLLVKWMSKSTQSKHLMKQVILYIKWNVLIINHEGINRRKNKTQDL